MSKQQQINKFVANNAMTVADLRELLAECDDDTLVTFVSDYGDIGNTQQALLVTDGEESEVLFKQSAYSHSGLELIEVDGSEYDDDDDNDDDDDDDEAQFVLVLKCTTKYDRW